MAKVLGLPGYPFVVIDHPISSATLDELADRARQAADEVADAAHRTDVPMFAGRRTRGPRIGDTYRCRPHSVLSEPAHRPARGSSRSSVGLVQGRHPIEG